MSNASHLKCIAVCCSGDITAFVREQWTTAVQHICCLILCNPHDAEEAAQDAFGNLYKSRGQLREPNKFRIWYYRI